MKVIKLLVYLACLASLGMLGIHIWNNQQERDTTPPTISVPENTLIASIHSKDKELLEGTKAVDDKNGEISSSVFIDKITKGANQTMNEFDISYVVVDDNLNVSKAQRKLKFTDYHPPRYSIKEPLEMTTKSGLDLRTAITAEDVIDGDITPFIKFNSDSLQLDSKEEVSPGNYDVNLEVTNSLGDTTILPVTIKVTEEVATRAPRVILSDYSSFVPLGEEYNPQAYLEYVEDNEDKGLAKIKKEGQEEVPGEVYLDPAKVIIESNVDTHVPGLYQVKYTYTSPESGLSGTTIQYVCVEKGAE